MHSFPALEPPHQSSIADRWLSEAVMATPSSARRKQPSAPSKSQRDAPAVTEAHAATLEPPSATRTNGTQRLGSSPSSRQRSSSRGNSRSGSGSNSRRASLSAGGLRAPSGSGVASAGRRGGRSRAGSVHVADAAAAAAVAASVAAAAAAAATSLAPAAPRFPPSPRLSAPPALASALVDSSNWPYRIGAPAAQIHVDPALSTTALTLVTCPRRKQTLLVNNIATVRQMYQHVKLSVEHRQPTPTCTCTAISE